MRTIGKGISSIVKLGVLPETGQKVAVKILKENIENKQFDDEILSLRELDNLHVVKLLGWGHASIKSKDRETKDSRYIVTEYGTSGEFFDFISICEPLNEKFARYYFN